MNGDQIRLMMATIEVMSNAMRLVLAERIADMPEEHQDRLVEVLERNLARPSERSETMTSPLFMSKSDLATWMPIAAGRFVEGVREQLRDLDPAEKAAAPAEAEAEDTAEILRLRRTA